MKFYKGRNAPKKPIVNPNMPNNNVNNINQINTPTKIMKWSNCNLSSLIISWKANNSWKIIFIDLGIAKFVFILIKIAKFLSMILNEIKHFICSIILGL